MANPKIPADRKGIAQEWFTSCTPQVKCILAAMENCGINCMTTSCGQRFQNQQVTSDVTGL